MQKWEYLFLRITYSASEEKITDKTNEKGEQGWELVSAMFEGTASCRFVLVFKKRKPGTH